MSTQSDIRSLPPVLPTVDRTYALSVDNPRSRRGVSEDSFIKTGCGAVTDGITSRVGSGISAAVMSAAAFGVGTWALVTAVQRKVASAQPSGTAADWIARGRGVYDNCYNGCNDCDDINFAFNACATTVRTVNGTNCDANTMWNWLDRVPEICAQSIGQGLSLADVQKADRREFAAIVGIFFGCVALGIGTYAALRGIARARGNN